jgi:hypothetical protein
VLNKFICSFLLVFIFPFYAQATNVFSPLTITRIPGESLSYHFYANGRVIEKDSTNKMGDIKLKSYSKNTPENILLVVFDFGTFNVTIRPGGKVGIERLSSWSWMNPGHGYFDAKVDCCKDSNFYAIKLLGKDAYFDKEPYLITAPGFTHEGVSDGTGYIFIDELKRDTPSLRLDLCSGPPMRITLGKNMYSSKVDLLEQSVEQRNRPKNCNGNAIQEYAKKNPTLNQGMPFLFSSWEEGISPIANRLLLEKNAKKAEEDGVSDYEKAVIRNDDPLAWLGPLPKKWSSEIYGDHFDAILKKIVSDIDSLGPDAIQKFHCKKPQAVGPTPNMQAVERYLESFPDSIYKQDVLANLYKAAAQGNWLAVSQILPLSMQSSSSLLASARQIQLMEWMLKRKIGGVYREVGYLLGAKGRNSFDEYAALNASYPAQYDLGMLLRASSEPDEVVLGNKLVNCAMNALPAYKKALSRE